jgi:chromosome partitioning protein
MTRTISIANHKGGAGKTTTAVSLAASLAAQGREVILIDLDPQANASSWLEINDDRGIYSVFAEGGSLRDEIKSTSFKHLAVVPANQRLAGAERFLAGELGAETILKRHMFDSDLKVWDYVIFDTPPALNLLTINALAASTEVLVPVEAHVLALSGVAQMMTTMALVRERLNPFLKLTGLLICRFDSRTRHSLDVKERLTAKFGDKVLKTVIRENVRLAEAPSFGAPIGSYAPNSPGACDYRALAAEIIATEEPLKAQRED